MQLTPETSDRAIPWYETDDHERALERILGAISRIQSILVRGCSEADGYSLILDELLALSESQTGMIGEIVYTSDEVPFSPDTPEGKDIGALEDTSVWVKASNRDRNGDEVWSGCSMLAPADSKIPWPKPGCFARTSTATGDRASSSCERCPATCGAGRNSNICVVPLRVAGRTVGMACVMDFPCENLDKFTQVMDPFFSACAVIVSYLVNLRMKRRADEILRKRSELLKEVVDQLEMICRITPDGVVKFANLNFCKTFGIDPGTIPGFPLFSILSQEDVADTSRLFDEIRASRLPASQLQFSMKDGGEVRWIEWKNIPILENGEVTEIQRLGQDVTKLRAAIESTARLASIVNCSDDAIFLKGLDGTILTWNPGAERIYGYREEDIVGKSVYFLAPEEEHTKIDENLEKVASGETIRDLEAKRVRSDGSTIVIAVTDSPYRNSLGEIIGASSIARDITDRIRAENAARESQKRLELALAGANLGLWDWNIQTGETAFNERWASMLGYTLDEIDSNIESWSKLVHPEDLPLVEDLLGAHLEGKIPFFRCELRLRTKSGEWKWILDSGRVLEFDESGNPLRAAGTHMDISELKAYQESLETAMLSAEDTNRKLVAEVAERKKLEGRKHLEAERLRALFEVTSIPGLNYSDQIQQTLKVGCRILGMTVGIISRIDESANSYVVLHVNDCNDLGLRQGDRFSFDKTYCHEVFTTGKPLAIDNVGSSRLNVHPCYVSTGLESYLGAVISVRRKPFGTINFSKLRPNDEPFEEADMNVVQLLGRWVSVIIERMMEEDEMREAKVAAEAASQAKTSFLATMSHEIRTPMNSILGMSSLLLDARLPDEYKNYVKVLRNSGDTLLTLINDILDISKVEAGKIVLEKVSFDLRDLIDSTARMFSLKAAGANVVIDAHFNGLSEGTQFIGDPVRLRQILVNLIGNAVKFTLRGSVSIAVECLEQAGNRERAQASESDAAGFCRVKISVKDTGIGIPEEKLDGVFDAFVQADSTTTRKFGGSGLGLSICKKLAELMNGTVSAISEVGKGSTFTLELPLQRFDGTREESDATAPEGILKRGLFPGAPFRKIETPTILIADDSPDNITLFEAYCKGVPVEIVSVTNGREAVDALRDRQFDAIFMDMLMPVMDGMTAVGIIRAMEHESGKPRLPIVGISANAFREDIERSRVGGCTGYLVKPVSRDTLFDTLNALFGIVPASNISAFSDEAGSQGDAPGLTAGMPKASPTPQSHGTDGAAHTVVTVDPLLAEIVPEYLSSKSDDLARMEKALQEGEMELVTRLGHSLKGSGASYGFDELSRIGAGIEAHGKAGNRAEISNLFSEMKRYLDSVEVVYPDGGNSTE